MGSNESNIIINSIKKSAILVPIEKSTDILLRFLYSHYNLYDGILERQERPRKIISVINRLSSSGNSYFPKKIQQYINSRKTYKIIYKRKLYSREVTLNFYVFTKNANLKYYDEIAHYVFLILYLFDQFSSIHSNKTLTIDVYMTPFRRELPLNAGSPIGPMNVNGGFTMACSRHGSITIYRQQEWFKVLIHEAMHSFCLDFATQDQGSLNKKLSTIFPINSKFNIFETYSEMWAEIFNVSLVSFELNKIKNTTFENFTRYFEYLISIERKFCFFQASKILQHSGISYTDLLKGGNKYTEESNIFAYYICRCILYLDYNKFISWCHTHNTHFFNFTQKRSDIMDFYNFISKYRKNKLLISMFKDATRDYINLERSSGAHHKFLKDNLRMTSVEI